MTDRELLELAAKAAGLTIHANNQASRDACGAGDVGLWISRESTCWNPLADDGDALRLAVRLGLVVESDSKAASSVVRNTNPSWMPEGSWDVHSVNHNGDPLAATRRAITRAAAEIGKGMK